MVALILWARQLMETEILKSLKELHSNKKFAVGNDLVFIPDFRASFNDLFKNKVYRPSEIDYCDQFDDALLRYASTWAAKEAVYKAIKQLDAQPISWKNIQIHREKAAKQPHVLFHPDPQKYPISLTLSHDGDYAWAIAFLDRS